MAQDDTQTEQGLDPDRVDREILLPAPTDVVWSVVTGRGWLAEEVELDLVPGGDASFADGDSVRAGWVEEAEPPARDGDRGHLVYWWATDGEPASRVELILDPEDNSKTRLRITETRPLEVLDLVGIPVRGSGSSARGPALLMAA
jgi:hypothetical protein